MDSAQLAGRFRYYTFRPCSATKVQTEIKRYLFQPFLSSNHVHRPAERQVTAQQSRFRIPIDDDDGPISF